MKDVFTNEEIVTKKADNALPLDINFKPFDPVSYEGNVSSIHPIEEQKQPFEFGLHKEPYHAGILETAKAQFKQTSELYSLHETAERQAENSNPLDDEYDPNWNPMSDPSMMDVDIKYKPYMAAATSKKDQTRRYSQVLDLQERDKLIENGSYLGWALGGLSGLSPFGSPSTLIPIAGQVKYARYAPTLLNTVARTLPGVALSSVAHEAAMNTNQVTGSLENFAVNTFADIVFGEALFGGAAVGARLIDTAALYEMKKLILPYYHGIDYKLKINKDNEIIGYQAVDTTGSLSAQAVSYAQDLADSTFAKTGFFKIPFVSEGFNYTFQVFSPIMRGLNSPYQTVRGVFDRVANHSIITEGLLKGKAAPQKFENEFDKIKGQMRVFSAQMTALHLVRNGQDISRKPRALIQTTSYLKELKNKVSQNDYVSVEEFHSEIDHAVRSGDSSPHAAVNEAANMIKNLLDTTYTAWRKAFNLPETWLPPKTAQNYLMRVYNTPYMNLKRNEWNSVITSWLKEADDLIESHMSPINDIKLQITNMEEAHQNLIRSSASDDVIKKSSDKLMGAKRRLKSLQDTLQNELRSNEDLRIHIDDHGALSADEANELTDLLKPLSKIEQKLNEQKQIVANLKKIASRKKQASIKGKTVETAKKHALLQDEANQKLVIEEDKLRVLIDEYDKETDRLQQAIHDGKVNPALYERIPDSQNYKFKDPNNRLKFRETYKSDFERLRASEAYYETIMNQTPEQLTEQVMSKLTGGARENPLKQRTLLVPDHILAQAKFLSPNLVHNVINYKYFLGRRTILKNIFKDVSIDGGFDPMVESLANEHRSLHQTLSKNMADIDSKLQKLKDKLSKTKSEKNKNVVEHKIQDLQKKKKAIEKELIKKSKQLDTAKEQLSIVYDKMMGRRIFGKRATKYGGMIMSYLSAIKLGFVPFSQITDLAANVLQHGLWPFIRDGIVPAIESMAGILKTKDSEALRNAASHVHLGVQDILTGYADKNFSGQAQPYFNFGSTVANGLENIAHLSSNLTGTNYIDNGLQHITASIAQSTFMDYMYQFKNGTLSEKNNLKLLQYGLDPKEWADRFITEFEKAGAHKTKLGGYNSNFWLWQDLEASNKFADAVFRGVKDTVIARGMLDAPFFMDHPFGAILMSFKGWTFASLNRYVIPAMQKADADKLIGVAFMLGVGALVSPARRIAAGKDPYPDDVTPGQIMWAAAQDSGFFSIFSDILSDMNIFTGNWLLGNLQNERYRDRTMAGLLGPGGGVANDIYSILGSMWSREINQTDVNKAARLLPFTQLTEFRALTNTAIDHLDIPKTRAEARRLKAAQE